MGKIILFMFFPLLFVISCSGLTPRGEIGERQITVASWYGGYFHGRRTASGEVYDMYGLTAAHRSLPFGTQLKVTHRDNGKSVYVIVNDRGPFVRGRSLDLSYGAAQALDMVRSGIAPVEIEIVGGLERPKSAHHRNRRFSIQVGSYQIKERAESVRDSLNTFYQPIHIVPHRAGNQMYFRVWVGHYRSKTKAGKVAQEIRFNHGLETLVVRRNF